MLSNWPSAWEEFQLVLMVFNNKVKTEIMLNCQIFSKAFRFWCVYWILRKWRDLRDPDHAFPWHAHHIIITVWAEQVFSLESFKYILKLKSCSVHFFCSWAQFGCQIKGWNTVTLTWTVAVNPYPFLISLHCLKEQCHCCYCLAEDFSYAGAVE